eukprot:GDKI01009317.1.p1 GENE.GDKI01009317.1~~GDKI01009317.1.p1  ORF type:complete len:180 (-),score=46.69 GDKI01009317.1:260-799(-)
MLREATVEDAEALSKLKIETFRVTFLDDFKIPYPPSDLEMFQRENYDPKVLEADLQNPLTRTWVVEERGGDGVCELVAYAKVSLQCGLPHTDVRDGDGEICQLYVRKCAQGRGYGKLLMDTCMGYLYETKKDRHIWLGVWSGNVKAHKLYGAYGFKKVGDYKFKVGTWQDEEEIWKKLN